MFFVSFFVSLCFFIALCFFVFYLPGFCLLKILRASLTKEETVGLSLSLGLVIFTLAGFLLGLLQERSLLLPIIFLIVLGTVFHFKRKIFEPFDLGGLLKQKFIALLFLVGILTQGAINFPSGWRYQGGVYFWSSHGHDGLWHIALMEEFKKSFPGQIPTFAGLALKNYHFLVDLLMSEFHRLFGFSTLDLYFRFFPILFSFLIGINSFIFVKKWQKEKEAALWAVFFAYLSGSFGFIVTLLQGRGGLNGETIFWVSQNNTILGNPPHAVSFGIIAALLFSLLNLFKTKSWPWILICSLLTVPLLEFKVYAGITILAGLLAAGIFEFFLKRQKSALAVFSISAPLSFLMFLPNTSGSSEFLRWQPWWFIRTMVVAPDRLNWIDLELRRQHYVWKKNWARVIQMELEAFSCFLFGNLGTRFIGFLAIWQALRKRLKISTFDFFFLVCLAVSFLIPCLFVQKGVAWNTIQFMQYFLFFASFWAAVAAYRLTCLKNRVLKILVAAVIVIFTIPTVIGNFTGFYGGPAFSRVTPKELEALNYLTRETDPQAVILTYPFDKYSHMAFELPYPIYSWDSTAYVAAFSGRRTYLADEGQATILGYLMEERRERVFEFFNAKNAKDAKRFLEEEKIDYIYLVRDQKFVLSPEDLRLEEIFKNEEVRIYKV